jgi:hypothetical protein
VLGIRDSTLFPELENYVMELKESRILNNFLNKKKREKDEGNYFSRTCKV